MRKTVPFLLALISSTSLVSAQEERPKQPEAPAKAPATETKTRETKTAPAKAEPKPEAKTAQPKPEQAKPVPTTPAPATPAAKAEKRKATSTPAAATPSADASAETTTPKPKKPGFFQRLFGRRPKATPMPVATPVPQVTPARRPRRPKSTPAPAIDQASNEAATEANASKEKATNNPPAGKTTEKKSDQPPTAEKSKEAQALAEAMASGDADTIEKAKYDDAKARASADPKVKELKEKADAAPTEEEGRKALRAYNKALFQKMRSIDGSIKDRVDQMEAAVMKRLQSQAE